MEQESQQSSSLRRDRCEGRPEDGLHRLEAEESIWQSEIDGRHLQPQQQALKYIGLLFVFLSDSLRHHIFLISLFLLEF